MKYVRMPIEVESPEEYGYDRIKYNLSESSVRDRSLGDLGIELGDLLLLYGEHVGDPGLLELIAAASSGAAGAVTTDGRARHGGRRPGALHHRHHAAREGRPPGGRPSQLRDQHLHAARHRGRHQLPGPDLRGGLGGRRRQARGADDAAHALRERHRAAQPHRPGDGRGRAAPAGRASSSGRLPPAGRRDLPRDDLRRAAARARPR